MATAFLHKEYVPTCFWWELAEMLRRFLLVGIFVVVEPGKVMQIVAGTIVCGVYLLVQLQAKPYKNDPEILAMTNLVTAYMRNEIRAFEKILKQNSKT